VASEGVLQCHSLVIPNLDGLVPRSAYNDGALNILVELDCGDPVSMSVLLNCELALTNGVPDLESLVSAT